MGIVFEPMTDTTGRQRGVRICDLPRTGAAALSRLLEVGDELLSINDRTMSRLSFDEIMDFIIEADPEKVNLLFRRPRKESLKEKQLSVAAAGSTETAEKNSVKWNVKETKEKRRKDRKEQRKGLKEVANDNYTRSRRKKKAPQPWESESFLDLLIDSICSPLVNGDGTYKINNNRSGRSRKEDYSDEDDDTYHSGDGDDSTCLTYESQENKNKQSRRYENKKKIHHVEDESTLDDEEETLDDYTNDETTLDSRKKQPAPVYSRKKMIPVAEPKEVVFNKTKNINTKENTPIVSSLPLPIEELEYDDQIDGADVSVMTPSTPSLVESNFVSATALMHGKENYMPHELGMTVEETSRNETKSEAIEN